ncbi:hypothetical protein CC78DRAFT_524318 [Lojkania enalia]|uniref:Uncharacterized protein n=1 Tax=Lojkania enalia TaxID=147567 RepID=A0A9P4K1G9_9PLEO|nr:hypothetical protein CC78DRAFT_524318 [Didymosphaeria enalia]
MTSPPTARSPRSTPGSKRAAIDHTTAAAAFDALGRQPRQALFRPAQPLTFELANHSKAYLESRQYIGGFTFLNSLLTSGASISTPAKPYAAYLAPAPQLALASTLIVYPVITTKSRSADGLNGSNAALNYLRNVQTTISPLHKSLRDAYAFPDERSRRRTGGRGMSNPQEDNGLESDQLAGLAANSQSLWYRAVDFWHVVGWAFNCSVLHRKRWERWKLWLDVTLGYLEREWSERIRLSKEEDANMEAILKQSLLWHYIASEGPINRANRRRMVKAILAMASSSSRSQFAEIWESETVEPKIEEDEELTTVNIENGDFGDFQVDDEDVIIEDVQGPSAKSLRSAPRKPADEAPPDEKELVIRNAVEAIEHLGGMDAIQLRQRLLALLVQAAQALPWHFTRLSDLFDHFTEDMVHLPTFIFSLLISTSNLSPRLQMGLNANLLLPLLSGQLPDYTVIDPTQSHLEVIFLPSRATTHSYATNAKISLVLEQMFIYMLNSKSLIATDALRKAVELGIEARHSVYGTAKGKKGNAAEEEQAKLLMEQSSERLLGLLEVLEINTGKPPQPYRAKSQSFVMSSLSSDLSFSTPPGSNTEDD